jgi:hypothetical protein
MGVMAVTVMSAGAGHLMPITAIVSAAWGQADRRSVVLAYRASPPTLIKGPLAVAGSYVAFPA